MHYLPKVLFKAFFLAINLEFEPCKFFPKEKLAIQIWLLKVEYALIFIYAVEFFQRSLKFGLIEIEESLLLLSC